MSAAGLLSSVLVLTFNIWGLPDVGFLVLSPLRTQRVALLCERLKQSPQEHNWGIVLLQEVWTKQDRTLLKECGYPHFADKEESSRPLDSGLLILSQWPLEQVDRLIFSAKPDEKSAVENGELFARKSALIARVIHPILGPFWVSNTHLVASYNDSSDGYIEIRRRQFREYVLWSQDHAQKEPLILGGDFNFGPHSVLWDEILGLLPDFMQAPEASTACTVCPPNFMHSGKSKKLDHLLGSPRWVVTAGSVVMDGTITISGLFTNYSDHFGWESQFGLHSSPPQINY